MSAPTRIVDPEPVASHRSHVVGRTRQDILAGYRALVAEMERGFCWNNDGIATRQYKVRVFGDTMPAPNTTKET